MKKLIAGFLVGLATALAISAFAAQILGSKQHFGGGGIMKCIRDVLIPFLAVIGVFSLPGCQDVPMWARQNSGYPQQEVIILGGPVERLDLSTQAAPASSEEVTSGMGTKFSSLPRLGVLLVMVTNKGREKPIATSRQSVRLTLPDGRILRPLEPSEMIAWYEEFYGSTSKDSAFLDVISKAALNTEKEFMKVSRGQSKGTVCIFRFPQGVPSGSFSVEYVLDLGGEEQLLVKQQPRLHLRP